jgi:hypothetical protein
VITRHFCVCAWPILGLRFPASGNGRLSSRRRPSWRWRRRRGTRSSIKGTCNCDRGEPRRGGSTNDGANALYAVPGRCPTQGPVPAALVASGGPPGSYTLGIPCPDALESLQRCGCGLAWQQGRRSGRYGREASSPGAPARAAPGPSPLKPSEIESGQAPTACAGRVPGSLTHGGAREHHSRPDPTSLTAGSRSRRTTS